MNSNDIPLRLRRIHSVDAIRAVALLIILIVHCNAAFDCTHAAQMPGLTAWLQATCYDTGFLMFSFLFGLSFFLQMDHATVKGIDYRGRFCLRLCLLLLFGVFDQAFFAGDILITFALMGFLLVLIWKLPTRVLMLLILLALTNPSRWSIWVTGDPQSYDACIRSFDAWVGNAAAPFSSDFGSLREAVSVHLGPGLLHKLAGMTELGRFWAMVSMFLLGVIAGRHALFHRPKALLIVGAVCLAVALPLYFTFDALRTAGDLNLAYLIGPTQTVSQAGAYICALGWLFSRPRAATLIHPLTCIGRMTLTAYIGQNILCSYLFCAWGLHLTAGLSTGELCLIGAGLYAALTVFACLWLSRFKYGPLEALWRRLTRIGMKKA